MRLIDVDTININDTVRGNNDFAECIRDAVKTTLDNALTVNAIIIPEGATNGDMITAIFPNVEVKEKNNGYEVYFGVGTAIQFFNHQWWNVPYNAESEVNADDE